MQSIFIILTGITAAIIGALPFGLVNLTVLDTAYRNERKQAMHIAHGAAWIEVLFGLIAISIGNKISAFMNNKSVFYYLILLLPTLVGIILLFRKKTKNKKHKLSGNNFLKGIFLNLISIQVLLYWLIAVMYINQFHVRVQNLQEIMAFLAGVWIGKMLVLWFYASLSKVVFTKWQFLSSNMNRVIGIILLLSVFIQFLK